MSTYQIKPVDRKYSSEMLGILQSSPIKTRDTTICFDRQPSPFRMAEIKYNPLQYRGLFDQNLLKGFGMIGYHQAMVNRKQQMVFHLKDFYVLEEARGNGFVYGVTNQFFNKTYQGSCLGYSVIMSGNEKPHKFVGSKNSSYPNIPYTRIVNQLDVRNILILLPAKEPAAYRIRPATFDDIPVIVSLLNTEHHQRLFGNCYNQDTFRDYLDARPGLHIGDYYLAFDRNGKCVGVCAAWDCSSFKQTRVLSYGKRFRPAKMLYNSLASILHKPFLPGPGEFFRELFITDYAVEERNPAIMNSLLRYVYRKFLKKGYQNMIWGSSSNDPLLKASRGFLKQRLVSDIVLISTKSSLMKNGAVENRLPYIDLPFL